MEESNTVKMLVNDVRLVMLCRNVDSAFGAMVADTADEDSNADVNPVVVVVACCSGCCSVVL